MNIPIYIDIPIFIFKYRYSDIDIPIWPKVAISLEKKTSGLWPKAQPPKSRSPKLLVSYIEGRGRLEDEEGMHIEVLAGGLIFDQI